MLSLKGKKILLSVHIFLISIWLGTALVIQVLLLLKPHCFGIHQIAIIDKVIFLLFDQIIMNISIAVAISGLIFSIFTTWGFVKFYWIITKWLILILLAIIIIFLASPVVNGMAALSDTLREQVTTSAHYLSYQKSTDLYIIVQLIFLTTVIFISVIKPWGPRKTKKHVNRKFTVSSGFIVGILLLASILNQQLQLDHYRNLKIDEVNLNSIEDGYYIGKANYAFEYEVGVTIMDHTISDIKFIKNRDSHYAKLAEGIKWKVFRDQKIDIDAVIGATTTSKIFLKAVEDAITSH